MAAGFTLNEFSSNLKALARPNRFLLSIVNEPTLKNSKVLPNNYEFLIKTAGLPEVTNEKIEVQWFGRQMKLAGEPKYGTFDATFRAPADWSLIDYFEDWSETVASISDNVRGNGFLNNTDTYKAVLKVQKYDANNGLVGSYFIHGAYPLSITPIELTQDGGGSISDISVSFSMSYWSNSEAESTGEATVSLA